MSNKSKMFSAEQIAAGFDKWNKAVIESIKEGRNKEYDASTANPSEQADTLIEFINQSETTNEPK